jgi:hypothetical protein
MATVINPPSERRRIMLIAGSYSVCGTDGILRIGPMEFDPDNWNTDTHKYTLYAMIHTNDGAWGVGCQLYNLTDLEQVGSTLIHSGDTNPSLKSLLLVLGSGAGQLHHGSHQYECWLDVTGGAAIIGTISQMYIQVEHK